MTSFIDSSSLVLLEHRVRLDQVRHDIRRDIRRAPSSPSNLSRRQARRDRRGGRSPK